ncbi:MAG TPA: ABC transporter permease [Deltaproteobacteria bacterium]|nr:ABC transporter permease [Deltaproteobacteria bacterium]
MRHTIDLIFVLTHKEMKIRYKSSVFGYVWSIAQPLAFAFVFYVAFKIVMRIDMEDYALFLIAGLFPWQWFNNSVTAAPMVFLGNASIIKKVNFPRNVTILATVLQDMIHFVLSIPVLVLFIYIYGHSPAYLAWLYGIPLLLAVQLLMVYGVAVLIASINLFFRDLERLTIILMTFMFYFTPVLYSVEMIPREYLHLVNLNPVAPLMISWRELILHGALDPASFFISLGYAVLFFLIGHGVYRSLAWRFAEVL